MTDRLYCRHRANMDVDVGATLARQFDPTWSQNDPKLTASRQFVNKTTWLDLAKKQPTFDFKLKLELVASWENDSSRQTESSSEQFASDLSLLKAAAPAVMWK